ncbi:MAG TPA: hypothetical protein VKP88_08965 [Candidatus Paceibacterota bacterium]|nr:hypothetical protein [Candidatus Paceibacterota bacterium]
MNRWQVLLSAVIVILAISALFSFLYLDILVLLAMPLVLVFSILAREKIIPYTNLLIVVFIASQILVITDLIFNPILNDFLKYIYTTFWLTFYFGITLIPLSVWSALIGETRKDLVILSIVGVLLYVTLSVWQLSDAHGKGFPVCYFESTYSIHMGNERPTEKRLKTCDCVGFESEVRSYPGSSLWTNCLGVVTNKTEMMVPVNY